MEIRTIELEYPHGFLIWNDNKQSAIADDKSLPVGEKLLLISNGEAFGYITLEQPSQVSVDVFHTNEWQEQHKILERERRQHWPNAKMLYVHRFKNWQPFETAKAYDNGQVSNKQLSDKDRKAVALAKQLPKTIMLDSEAVVFTGGKFVVSKIAFSDELKDILKATYNEEPQFTDRIDIDKLPLYQLALIRNPAMRVKKNESVKQEDGDMPWEKVQNHSGCSESEPWAVVKVDNGELEGCHSSEEAANRQLAALNIAESERSRHNNDEEDEDKLLHGHEGEALEQRLGRIQEQFFRVDNANIIHTFDDHLIVESGGELFRVNYFEANDILVFDPREKWLQVDVTFEPRVRSDIRSWKNKLVDAAKSIFSKSDNNESNFMLDLSEPFGIAVKDVNGEPWHFAWSTNAFEDREGEIFTTKALEDYVSENEKRDKDKRGTFNLWHIPGTDFARKEWQGVPGRFLIEAGPYLDNHAGKAAKEFFTKFPDGHPEFAPEGWGSSPEFRFLPEERMKDGIFHWLWITKTSTLPRAAAANLNTKGSQIMALTKDQEALAVEAFGKEFVDMLQVEAEDKTAELENAGVAHKENDAAEAEAETQEAEDTTEDAEQPEAINVDIDELAAAVSSQFILKLEPVAEAMVNLAEETKAIGERVAQLEKQEAVKAQVETPRFTLQRARASEAVETVVGEKDDLKDKGPGNSLLREGESAASRFFTE